MIFDTHAHYDDEQFNDDRDSMLSSMKEEGVGLIVNIGASLESSEESIKLAKNYDFVYAAVGVHPDNVGELEVGGNFDRLCNLARQDKVVTIGEIGLDYHWMEQPKEVQAKWFKQQLSLARELGKPVNIHSRDAAEDTLKIIQRERAGDMGGIIHCFSYSVELALEYVKMGFCIGIGGVVTFKNAKKLKEVVNAIPLERLVLETDCPYLAPEPNRGKRNSSLYLSYVANTIATIKKCNS